MKTFQKILLFIAFSIAVLIGVACIALAIISLTSRTLDTADFDDYSTDYAEEAYFAEPLFADVELAPTTLNSRISAAVIEGSIDTSVEEKVIKTAHLAVQVDSVEATTDQITTLVSEFDGFVQSAESWQYTNSQLRGSMTVRVPAEQFEHTVLAIKEYATQVNSESITGQDVTEQYTDLQARLQNAELQEAELQRLLEQAGTVEEILAVQAELNNAREDVELLQGRLNYLANQTEYSTISIELTEEVRITTTDTSFRPGSTAREAGRALILLVQYSINAIIWVVIVAGGILLPLILLTWLVISVITKKIKKHTPKK